MTLNKLHKLLGELIAQGHGRCPVAVDKATFHHNCEGDGITILPIEGVTAQWVGQDDGDGSIKINKDGTEHGIVTVYFFGGSYERATDRELGAP